MSYCHDFDFLKKTTERKKRKAQHPGTLFDVKKVIEDWATQAH